MSFGLVFYSGYLLTAVLHVDAAGEEELSFGVKPVVQPWGLDS